MSDDGGFQLVEDCHPEGAWVNGTSVCPVGDALGDTPGVAGGGKVCVPSVGDAVAIDCVMDPPGSVVAGLGFCVLVWAVSEAAEVCGAGGSVFAGV